MLGKLERLVVAGTLSAVVAGGIVSVPAAAKSPTVSRHAAARSPRARLAATGACFSGNIFGLIPFVCFWSHKGFSGAIWTFGGGASDPSLRQANDRVVSMAASGDFSFAAIRLYRDTDFYGAWVCIPLRRAPGVRWVYNVGHFRFNDGAGRAGYGQAVARNFKSIGFSTSRCTNPV